MIAPLLAILLAQQLGAGDGAYRAEIEAWRRQREERLKADGGWLTVAGLAWLTPGRNRFGAEPSNEVILPAHSAPGQGGAFVLDGKRVTIEVAPGVPVTLSGKPVTRADLKTDAGGAAPDLLVLGALTMQIIDRGGRLGVRVKDMKSAARRDFKGLRWYAIKPEYRVTARFVPHAKPTTIAVPSVLGGAEPMPSPGVVSFELGGKKLQLHPVIEPGDTKLFFILRDATSGKSTYGAGRFLYADPPAHPRKEGQVVLDFNKLYSPPCAFTPYATCPLPPPGNRLDVNIEAGELSSGSQH